VVRLDFDLFVDGADADAQLWWGIKTLVVSL
jgi:hypothetical protein